MIHCFKAPSTKLSLFHFQAAWTIHPIYEQLVSQTWHDTRGDVISKMKGILG